MKNVKKIITLIFLGASTFISAQIVNIPDANFKARLLQADETNTLAKDLSDNYFKIDANNNGEIEESEALAVSLLSMESFSISDLTGIDAFTNLIELKCYQNDLTELNISQNVNLQKLFCLGNQLSSLNVTQNVNLITISCADNLLTEIDVTQNVNLQKLYCYFNQIEMLDTSNNINLQELWCMGNQLTNLDVSQNVDLVSLQCQSNQLTTLFIKNGSSEESLLNFGFNPDLIYICADEGQIDSVQALADATTVVSSYCSFIPGGDYNTITGNITYDSENDGCDVNDDVFPFIKININDGTDSGSTFTNYLGEYNFYTQEGNFLITPDIENPTFFDVLPTQTTINFLTADNGIATQDFCITANGVHNDVEIVLAPTIPARPGFDAEYVITYKNKGNQTVTGDFSFAYDDTVLDYISSTETPTTQTTGILTWDFINLLPFESRSVYVTLNVNDPTETPAVNIADVLDFGVVVNPIVGDELPADNTFNYNQIVVGSYDPNDITCIEGDIVAPTEIGEYLHYIINFENTGTAPAENIVVKTELDPTQFDVNSLRLLSSSHNPYVRIKNNIVEFIFEAIYLDTGGHGNILLKVQSDEDLETEDTVTKNANIYFDYNFPIETNNANTTFQLLSTPEFELDDSIHIYPNPVNAILNISARSNIKSVSLYDVQGRLLQTKMNNSNTLTLEIASRASGIYFVKIVSDKGAVVEKIIKQ